MVRFLSPGLNDKSHIEPEVCQFVITIESACIDIWASNPFSKPCVLRDCSPGGDEVIFASFITFSGSFSWREAKLTI